LTTIRVVAEVLADVLDHRCTDSSIPARG
jgi:hypothetical protein